MPLDDLLKRPRDGAVLVVACGDAREGAEIGGRRGGEAGRVPVDVDQGGGHQHGGAVTEPAPLDPVDPQIPGQWHEGEARGAVLGLGVEHELRGVQGGGPASPQLVEGCPGHRQGVQDVAAVALHGLPDGRPARHVGIGHRRPLAQDVVGPRGDGANVGDIRLAGDQGPRHARIMPDLADAQDEAGALVDEVLDVVRAVTGRAAGHRQDRVPAMNEHGGGALPRDAGRRLLDQGGTVSGI